MEAPVLSACCCGRIKPLPVLGAALGSATSFFVISNLAVWVGGTLYPKTFAGLVTCYAAAIPFFQKGLASDLLFSTVFFGVPVLIAHTREALEAKAHKNIAA
jgi:hypothetical protein